jgi:hypothetical protein
MTVTVLYSARVRRRMAKTKGETTGEVTREAAVSNCAGTHRTRYTATGIVEGVKERADTGWCLF